MIIHSKEIINKHISKLQPLKYNQFYWWRKFKDKSPLSSKEALHARIDNGDFDFSSYYWQAQYALIEMEEKTGHISDPSTRHESQTIYRERWRRLMNDYEKEEPQRLAEYKKAITNLFEIEDKDLEKKMEDFDGTLKELYTLIKTNYNFRTVRKRKK
jgi:transketolase